MSTQTSQTDAIRHWIRTTAHAGHRISDIIDMMLKSGYTARQARRLVADTLNRPGIAIPVADTRRDGLRTTHPQPPCVEVGGRRIDVATCVESPVIRVLENVMDAAECDQLIEQARPRLDRSRTVTDTGTNEVSTARTSSGMFFKPGETDLISRIEQRIADLVDMPVENGEGLQILHYEPGQEYEPHYDWFNPTQAGYHSLTEHGGERVATVIVYLNTPEGGGGTHFPRAGVTVCARKGSAVYFAYENGDKSSLHAGLPVTRGEKWIATKWLRERPYR
ncbi:MAG TPA: 2OG-Fe(II) oxygenase [Rhodanobacteraceae bacterium]